jgi:foldase protein PrsA
MISTTETDADGKVKPLSEQMKAKEYKKVKKLFKEAVKADDFYAFAKANTESSDVEYIFGKGDMPEAFEKVAFSLKSGELSQIVETEEGYHIIYCVSDYDEDATLEKKEEMIEKRQDQYFQSLYKSWAKDYKTNVNDKIWSTLEFTSISNGNTTEDVTSVPLKNTVESSDKITPKP